jgi:hypothetical protein
VIVTEQIEFEIASDGQGSAPERILIPDANGFHEFENGVRDTFGSRVRSVELHLIDKSMPANGDRAYWGYLVASINPEFPNRIGISGAMLAGVPPFKAMVIVTYEQ